MNHISTNRFSGIVAALVTPFDSDGNIEYSVLKDHIRFLKRNGVDGFYVNGSTAEAFLLTQDERKQILETVLEENNGEKFVISHVGHISTAFATELALHSRTAGADAISAISPFYYKFTPEEIKQYYFDIMDASDMPMFIYNFPNFSGFSLTASLLSEIRRNPNVVGVKFTSNDFFQMERMRSSNPDLVIYNGYDEMCLSGLAAGADGAVGSTYNCLAPLFKQLYTHFQAGELSHAQTLQKQANDIIEVICKHGVFSSIKMLLQYAGLEFGSCRKPFLPSSETAKKELKQIYDIHLKHLYK